MSGYGKRKIIMAQKRIFVITPFESEFSDVYQAIHVASGKSEEFTNQSYLLFRADNIKSGNLIHHDILGAIHDADLIIADTSKANPNVLYELGFAEALDKPVIIINQRDYQAPFSVHDRHILLYDRKRLSEDLIPHLMDAITLGTRQPEKFSKKGWKQHKINQEKPSVFISYSHVDKEYLNRFRVHAKPLEKKGLIDIWVDTKIKAGDKWEKEIERALSHAAIAILMISADFLASDFIVDNELPPLLELAETKGTRILPIIIKPCRFSREPNLAKFQALNPPDNPLLLMPEIEQELLWDKLANEIEVEIDNRS